MPILDAKDVTFRYTHEDESVTDTASVVPPAVLCGVDLAIEQGTFVALLGHNGCGKSTLAKHFNAILLPTGGRVLVEGMDTADEAHTYDVRRTVGMVLQDPDDQLVSTVVEEDVAFGPENLGIAPDEICRRVEQALRTVGMWEYRAHSPHKLSGGQKQRVAIAGVLAMQPDVIVLDEPTAMLDPQGRQEVIDTVCRLDREQGMTVVLITHYMEEAARADRAVVMDGGRIIADGTPRQVFSDGERLRAVGLDVPQPTALCAALRQAGVDIPAGILTPQECADALLALMRRGAGKTQ